MSEKYIVFGATGSIGSSLAEQLVSSGNKVHLVARNEAELKNISGKLGCTSTVANVLEEGFIDKVKNDIEETKGIAYCVGSIDLKPLRMVTEQDFNKCMKLNLYSAVEAIKGYQESLKKNKGSVVLFSTVAAQRGFTNHSIIASTKAAVEGLTVSLAAEFAPNIRVNGIAPGPTIKNKRQSDKHFKKQYLATPLKKQVDVNEICNAVDFFIKNSSITGQVLAIDSGQNLNWQTPDIMGGKERKKII